MDKITEDDGPGNRWVEVPDFIMVFKTKLSTKNIDFPSYLYQTKVTMEK